MGVDVTWRARAIAALAVLGVTLALHAPVVDDVVGGSEAWFEWDVPEQYWPDLVRQCRQLHEGRASYWNPWDRAGYPAYADPQAGTFHPVNVAICALAGPSPRVGWATARAVIGFALAGLFGLLWLRRIGATWAGAIVGATLIEAAPFMRHSWELNLASGLAYAPLVLFAADRAAVERTSADGALLALALGLCAWVGSPPALFFTASLTGLYLVFRLGVEARRGRSIRGAAISLGVAAALSVGLLGVILVPGAHLAAHSVQAGRSLGSIAQGAADPAMLRALAWPLPGNHLYVGWLALALAPVATLRRDRLGWFFLAVAGLAVLMTTGGAVFRLAFELVPGVRHFRAPIRYEAWLGIAAGALAALGLTHLAKHPPPIPRPRAIAAGLALLGAVLLVALEGWTPGLFLLSLAVIAETHRRRALAAPLVGAALALLALLDITQALPDHRHMRRGEPACLDAAPLSVVPEGDRVMDEFAVGCRAGTRHRRRDLRGYQDPLLLASYERVVGSLRDVPALAPQLGVRWALQGPHFIHGWDRHYLPPPAELAARLRTRVAWTDGDRTVTELLDALPFAYFVPMDEVERVPDRQAALARTRELAPSAIAIVEAPGASGEARAERRPDADATDVRLEADALSLAIDAPTEGVVVVNEAFYPGWLATVDGRAAEVHRANGLVRAVEVAPGHHTIAMRFEPADGAPWRWAWAISLVAALVLIAVRVARRR